MESVSMVHNGGWVGDIRNASIPVSAPSGQENASSRSAVVPQDRKGITLPEDKVTLSGEKQETKPEDSENISKNEPKPGERTTADGRSLEDPEVKQAVEQLKRIEEKVKAHEAAHKSAGGSLAGSASYSYTQGPDGRNYITGGEVQIDMSTGRTPEETISRMQQVIRAALAPADPSGQDRAVAAQAANQMTEAQQEKMQANDPNQKSESEDIDDPARESLERAAQSDPNDNNGDNTVTANNSSRLRDVYGRSAVQLQERDSLLSGMPGRSGFSDTPLFSSVA